MTRARHPEDNAAPKDLPDAVFAILEPAAVLPIRHQILRPHQAIADCSFPGDDAPDTLHQGGIVSGKLVAVASVIRDPLPHDPDSADWRIRGMATLPEFRGRGLGGELLKACVRHADAHDARLVWCNARVGAVDLYPRQGFEVSGPGFDLPGIGPHYLMIRKL
jgi:GNAT superfamily N-acetyltransferase